MTSSENMNWSIPAIVVAIIALVVCISYFVSGDLFKQLSPRPQQEFDYAGRPVQQMVTPNQIILTKNEKFISGRNCLIFKGIERNAIIIYLYLLDMDPEQAYVKRFPIKDAKKELYLGKVRYRLVSVNDYNLTLKKHQ